MSSRKRSLLFQKA